MSKPNVLFVMTDQQRFDTIAALGNEHIYTPNFDRLVRRGVSFTNAYSTCPVCVPARHTYRSGCEPTSTDIYTNGCGSRQRESVDTMEARCGPFLARTMRTLGYRTFGIGKFHVDPWDMDLGYDVHLHSEELYGTPETRSRDAFAKFIAEKHPEFDWVEMLQGERTEMYYVPQMSPLPAEITVENWAATQAVAQIEEKGVGPLLPVGPSGASHKRGPTPFSVPFFGLVSFIGPHPPFAPPQPFNRMYDPDRMPNPVRGAVEVDHMDEQITWMNFCIWADDISDARARMLKARYYGEITYIDQCLGRILDAVDRRPDADNTLIVFFADHGDQLGDHHAWQKECFFEQSCHVPFLVSWPARLPADVRRDELVCLTDLFSLATGAAGQTETRDGIDLLGFLEGSAPPRERVIGMYGRPGTPLFKVMVRQDRWKYIYIANGGREQLFDIAADPQERTNLAEEKRDITAGLRAEAVKALCEKGVRPPDVKGSDPFFALDGDDLRAFPFEARPLRRIYQFARARGVRGFPDRPEDVLKRD